MEPSAQRAAVDADFALLNALAGTGSQRRVPSCPDWTLDDLLRHVALVYLHKAAAMRAGALPTEWPPPLDHEATPALLERAHAELTAEFEARDPSETTPTWYDPDQTVGFWIRRMALETAVHRVDAEQAAGVPVTPVGDELALDGIDEVLDIMLAWGSVKYREFRDEDLPTVELRSGGRRWFVRPTTQGVLIDASGEAETVIEASPSDALLWLWRRAGDEVITVTGDPAHVATLRDLMKTATE
ncbi:maleylpyruvate isomerase family mycothiol-dependent enzyme [Phytomonospora sp. NPDC050363]|uniref:maleylpyruvate isomerase family mycothiol-dependent enzyme n=1 Tax=Phytomonospora sp. NPDC050363 TaxID=3155642 RepID=UPI0034005AF3